MPKNNNERPTLGFVQVRLDGITINIFTNPSCGSGLTSIAEL